MTLITLTPKERQALEALAAQTAQARDLRRAQALLWLEQGEAVQAIADRLGVSRQTLYNWVTRFESRRTLGLAARLADAPRSGRPRTAYGVIDPLIDEVIERDPREFEYRSTAWTAPLLVEYLQDTHEIEVSCDSVRFAIRRLDIRWKRPRHTLALRAATWRQAKGG
jgi:transposase